MYTKLVLVLSLINKCVQFLSTLIDRFFYFTRNIYVTKTTFVIAVVSTWIEKKMETYQRGKIRFVHTCNRGNLFNNDYYSVIIADKQGI